MHQTGRNYLHEIEGLGRKMPVVFGCLTVAGVSLAGIPPFAGFISKWNLGTAGLLAGNPLGYAAIGVLLYSAFLTTIYMGVILLRAWFPRKESKTVFTAKDCEPGWKMKTPLVIFVILIVGLGLFSRPLVHLISDIAYGLF